MSCAACGTKEDGCKVSLTPNIHEALCATCFAAWVSYAWVEKVWCSTLGSVVTKFRGWCTARKKVAE